MLDVINLACSRGDRLLFRNLSFRLQAGELLHVQGANGCGKTTLLRSLCGLTQPEIGEILWKGESTRVAAAAFRRELCYIGHGNALHGDLTGLENLGFEDCLAGNPARGAHAALSQAGLGRVSTLPTKLLSQGQKRRTALARLLHTRCPLWVLDEPLTALDRHSTTALLDVFRQHLARGGMIILTSHQHVALTDWPVQTLSLEDA